MHLAVNEAGPPCSRSSEKSPYHTFQVGGRRFPQYEPFLLAAARVCSGRILLLFASLMCASTRTKEERWKRKKEVCPLDAATSHTLLINYLGRSFRVLCVKRTCSDCKTPPSTNSKTTTNRQKKTLQIGSEALERWLRQAPLSCADVNQSVNTSFECREL